MTSRQMSPIQLQTAYRMAVQSSLTAFYRKSGDEAKRLVDRWWNRISRSSDIESGMYLHSEALATAADLAHTEEVKLTDEVRQRYRRILHDSTRAAIADQQTKKVKAAAVLKQMAG